MTLTQLITQLNTIQLEATSQFRFFENQMSQTLRILIKAPVAFCWLEAAMTSITYADSTHIESFMNGVSQASTTFRQFSSDVDCHCSQPSTAIAYACQQPFKHWVNANTVKPHNSHDTVTISLWANSDKYQIKVTKYTLNKVSDASDDAFISVSDENQWFTTVFSSWQLMYLQTNSYWHMLL